MDNHTQPFFSIIVPIFKVENYLIQCIESILIQSFKDFELILVDDGSPDNCPFICDEYSKKYNFVKTLHKKNGGLSDARNAGIKFSTGSYLIFVDSDDYWDDSNALSNIFNILSSNDIDLLIWKCKSLNDKTGRICDDSRNYLVNLSLKSEDVLEYLVSNGQLTMSAWLRTIKRSLVIENNLFFIKNRTTEDIEWSTKVFEKVNTIFLYNSSFYVYRKRRTGSITSTISKKNIYDYIYVFNLCLDHIKKGKQNVQNILLNYFAYQFLLLCAQSFKFRKDLEYKKICKLLSKIDSQGIMNYRNHPKVKKAGFIYDLFGFKGLIFVFGHYLKFHD